MFVSTVRGNVSWEVSHKIFSLGDDFQKVAELKANLNRRLTWVDTFFVRTLKCHNKILAEKTAVLESFGYPSHSTVMGDKEVVEKLLEKLVKICEFLVYYTYGSTRPEAVECPKWKHANHFLKK